MARHAKQPLIDLSKSILSNVVNSAGGDVMAPG